MSVHTHRCRLRGMPFRLVSLRRAALPRLSAAHAHTEATTEQRTRSSQTKRARGVPESTCIAAPRFGCQSQTVAIHPCSRGVTDCLDPGTAHLSCIRRGCERLQPTPQRLFVAKSTYHVENKAANVARERRGNTHSRFLTDLCFNATSPLIALTGLCRQRRAGSHCTESQT